MTATGTPRLRLDVWLWRARFVRTRALAATLAGSGRLRVNGLHCTRAGRRVGPGDVLTFPLAGRIRVVRVEALGTRRGPAAEARLLYTDLDPDAGQAAMQPDDEHLDSAHPAPGHPPPPGDHP